ncbi:uncharacterized protein LOC125057666 [Pieris napi]|uniref:uncharacterized protein LOC125057666 n=1 Tax=Pieris napi TaxID=78633 RepID=UPI001FB95433|nr:uncharacterized protein LOC125057666 [Pieris napi]
MKQSAPFRSVVQSVRVDVTSAWWFDISIRRIGVYERLYSFMRVPRVDDNYFKMAVWSVEAVTGFIRIYREHPCLWQVKNKSAYTNRNLKQKAYGELIEYSKNVGFTTANRDFVTKKIQNLRGAFRKELKKVSETRNKSGSAQDDIYKPSLWYYDQMLFTKDQELPTPSISNIDIENENSQYTNVASQLFSRTNSVSPPRDVSPSPLQDTTNIASLPINAENTNTKESTPTPRGTKRKSNIIDTQIKFINVCTEALQKNSRQMTEYEALGVTISKKFEKMDKVQALYAESFIHTIIKTNHKTS